MHNFTHVKDGNLGKTGHGFYADGMVEQDALTGKLLDTVDLITPRGPNFFLNSGLLG